MMDFEKFLDDIGLGSAFNKDEHRGDPRYVTAFAFLDLAEYAKELTWRLTAEAKS